MISYHGPKAASKLVKIFMPRINRLVEAIKSRLRRVLPSQRDKALLCDAEMKELDRESFTLAVARYMKEHPLVTDIPILT